MAEKTIIMETNGGKLRKISVPEEFKVTFGAVAPGGKSGTYNGEMGWCLRVYRTKEQPVAVYTDVKSFRLEGIPVQEKVTTTKRRRVGKDGPRGFKDSVVEARVTRWVDPDEPDEEDEETAEFLALSDGSEEF